MSSIVTPSLACPFCVSSQLLSLEVTIHPVGIVQLFGTPVMGGSQGVVAGQAGLGPEEAHLAGVGDLVPHGPISGLEMCCEESKVGASEV